LQETKYLYGSTIDASWQTGEVDPDSTDSVSQSSTTLDWTINSGTDNTSTSYLLTGNPQTFTDQRGVVHSYTYDFVSVKESPSRTAAPAPVPDRVAGL
jgi:hypothetical protein